MAGSFGNRLLEMAAERSEVIRQNLADHGDAPLAEVLTPIRHDGPPPLQGREDLWEVVGERAARYYGSEVAGAAVAELRGDPVLSTSNHFGIDTLAVSVHTTLLYALRPLPGGGARRTAVVLGCGSVSMDSVTYPMGLLLYDRPAAGSGTLARRLAVYPNRLRRATVGAAGPFDAGMVARARSRLHRLRVDGEVSEFCERSAGLVLDEDLADPGVLALPSYAHQGTAVNARLWSRMFAGPDAVRLVQLGLEETAAALLARDLFDPASLVHRLFFDPDARSALLAGLDGRRACWRLADLRRRLADSGGPPAGDGTVFFWGMTEDGRRVPLTVEEGGPVAALAGVDGRGLRRDWDFTPDALAAALSRGELVPSLVTCFAVLAFARGVGCVGGPHQANYLPVMQRAVVEAVGRQDPAAADAVAAVPTRLCLADMQVAMRTTVDGLGLPAGPVEIAGAGGFSAADLDRITASVTVREAYLAAFPDIFGDVAPDADLPSGWIERLAAENATGLRNVVVLDGMERV